MTQAASFMVWPGSCGVKPVLRDAGALQSSLGNETVSPELVEGRVPRISVMVRQAHHQRILKDFAKALCRDGRAFPKSLPEL